MVTIISLILLPLAVATLIRLVVDDAITLPLRQKVVNRFGEDSAFTYLVHCPRCTGFWVTAALGTPTAFYLDPLPAWMRILAVLASWQLATTVLAGHDRLQSGGD